MKNHAKTNTAQNESGVVLIIVTCFTAIAAILAVGLMSESSSQLKVAKKNVSFEQAFYVAEGGAERAVSYIRQIGVTAATCITGSIGNGNYVTFIVPASGAGAGGTHSLSAGSLGINPNNSPDSFFLIKPDGTSITRDDLANDTTAYDTEPCVYYTGPAMLIHVKPHGAANTLTVDGAQTNLNASTTYDFAGDMNIVVQNDSRNSGNNHANGQWHLANFSGDDVTLFDGSADNPMDADQYEVRSIGTVEGARRTVILEDIHQRSWAEYAMWYNTGPSGLTIAAGNFYGKVHANCAIKIEIGAIPPHFYELVTSAANNWSSGSDTNPIAPFNNLFSQGYTLGAPTQTMASINFTNTAYSNTCLRSLAGLVVTGQTSIRLQSTNLFINNPQRGWTNVNYATNHPDFLGTGLIYVASSGTQTGTVQIAGTNFDGQLTVAADWDILITNHITYAANPSNSTSDDAIGLLSRHNIFITTNCPGNLNVYAHMMADGSATTNDLTDGKFEVVGYGSRPRAICQTITVYGGIVQNYRGCTSDSYGNYGYFKNYIYDTRFADNPPPYYPTLADQYTWRAWRDSP